MSRAVVVGAGIAGLGAARALAEAGSDVLVLEATDRPGGKLRAGEVAGVTVDVGAEAILVINGSPFNRTQQQSREQVLAERALENSLPPKLIEIVQAFECGAIMNPANLRCQMEGCIMMGLGPALRGETGTHIVADHA